MKFAAIASIILLSACASAPAIVDLGGGTFMVSKSAMTGNSGAGTMRAEALQQATDECRKLRRLVQVESENERERWYVPGNYRTLEIRFRCVTGPLN